MNERNHILERMSPIELAMYEAIGGSAPRHRMMDLRIGREKLTDLEKMRLGLRREQEAMERKVG